MRRALLLLALICAVAAPVRAEPLIADLSESVVKITTGFTGTKVLLFGAIDASGQVVVIVQGPRHSVVVREKQRTAGIWMNRRSVKFENVPAFYHVLSSDTLDEWLPLRTREQYEVGVEYLKLDAVGNVGPAKAAEFREALIRNMQRIGRYSRIEGDVTMLGGQLFRADLYLPANLPTGYYNIEVLLVRDGDVKSIQATPLLVTKSGLGAEAFNLAYDQPAIYGIIAIVIAVMAGVGANAIFRNI